MCSRFAIGLSRFLLHVPTEETEKKVRESAHVLNEVVARMTFDSHWDIAREILPSAAREVTAEIIKETSEEPYIRSDMHDYSVYTRLGYMTLATDRPRMKYEIEKRIFREFCGNDEVCFAIPYAYASRRGKEAQMLTKLFQTGDVARWPMNLSVD